MGAASAPIKAEPMLFISITPNEFTFPGTKITFTTDHPLDARTAKAAIFVKEHRGKLSLSPEGTTATWNPSGRMAPGAYTLSIGECVTREGERIGFPASIPFYLTDSVAKIPSNLRVIAMSRLGVGEEDTTPYSVFTRPKERFIETMKAVDRLTGQPHDLAFDQDGKPVDADKMFAQLAAAKARKYGKLQPALHRLCEKSPTDARLNVAIWLEAEDMDQRRMRDLKPPPRSVPPEVRVFRGRLVETRQRLSQRLAERFRIESVRPDRAAPVLYAQMTPEQIRETAEMQEVAAIYTFDPKGFEDLANSIAVAGTDHVQAMGITGAGVNVAVWENGPDIVTNLSIADYFDPAPYPTSWHARHTHAIIKNVEPGKPHGHAPDCNLYSANGMGTDALTWAVQDKNCTVISQSFHRDEEETGGGLSHDDLLKDWLVLHYPYPTIVQAAGNDLNLTDGFDEFVNHKGYNSLSVGNHDDTAATMSNDSCFANPTSPHHDRELPEIAANGTVVTTVGLTVSGTSMSAPAVAGVAALLQARQSVLKWWPEGCRAILMASASKNVSGSTWWKDVAAHVDARDGAGALNASAAIGVVDSPQQRNNPPTIRGWNIGTLDSDDFDAHRISTFSYSVQVPAFILGPRHVKVALAWNSTVGKTSDANPVFSSNLTLDFDLLIHDSAGTQVAASASYDNSYEIAEFDGKPGEVYTVKIRRWSGTDWTWFGIAWTVTGGIVFQPLPQITLES